MKKLFLKIHLFFISIFQNEKKFEQFLEDHVDDAIEIVNCIDKVLKSQLLATIISILPPKYAAVANHVKDRIQNVIDKVIVDILGIEDIFTKYPTFEERLTELIKFLKGLSPAMQEGAKLKMAVLYTQYSSGNRLGTRRMTDTVVQQRFFEKQVLS